MALVNFKRDVESGYTHERLNSSNFFNYCFQSTISSKLDPKHYLISVQNLIRKCAVHRLRTDGSPNETHAAVAGKSQGTDTKAYDCGGIWVIGWT